MTEENFEKAKAIMAKIRELKDRVSKVEKTDLLELRFMHGGPAPVFELPQQYLESVRAKYVMDLQNKIKRLEQDFNEL